MSIAVAGRRQEARRRQVVFVNGLGFEGWIDRLVKASGTKAPIVVATKASSRASARERTRRPGEHGEADPHAWQSVANAKIYVANIRDALIGRSGRQGGL